MRQVVMLMQQTDAQRFADYLLTRKIVCSVRAEGAGWTVWVRDEDKLDQARQELGEYTRDPQAGRYQEALATAQLLKAEEESREKQYRRNFRPLREYWIQPIFKRCPLTSFLLAASVLVAVLSQLGEAPEPVLGWLSFADPRTAADTSATAPDFAQVQGGEVWRLVTPIFLHFGALHLLFNLAMLYDLGPKLEAKFGWWRFLLFVLLTASLSNLAQAYVSGPRFGGMSGVLYAMFGYVLAKSQWEPNAGFALPNYSVYLMVGFYVLCLTGRVGPIGNAAHTVGLGLGLVIGGGRYGAERLRGWLRQRRRRL